MVYAWAPDLSQPLGWRDGLVADSALVGGVHEAPDFRNDDPWRVKGEGGGEEVRAARGSGFRVQGLGFRV